MGASLTNLGFFLGDFEVGELADALLKYPHLKVLDLFLYGSMVFPIDKFLQQTQTCESLILKVSE